jgi:hypothetical protein
MGDLAGDKELKAWAWGTQSLIARFQKKYHLAAQYVDQGLRVAGVGTSEVRLPLWCGTVRCQPGERELALVKIDEAKQARERAKADKIEGIFGFSPAKQAYYGASALMWLSDRRILRMSVASTLSAIDI